MGIPLLEKKTNIYWLFILPGCLFLTFFMLIPLFFLSFSAFFGEEYGWRFFFQPLLQKRFGLKGGVLILGVLWGLWHLPLNIFYYSPDTAVISILSSDHYLYQPGGSSSAMPS